MINLNFTLTFVRSKETKNTVVFSEVVDEGATAIVGVLYLQKSALEDAGAIDAEAVTVNVTSASAEAPSLSLV